ncbi:MAG: class I SAM-dependent methyltransferase [Hyphomicrobiales bacterium]
MIRRRRNAIEARREWAASPLAKWVDSQTMLAAITPRVARVIDLIELAPGRRYVDIGCGTKPFAELLAARAGLDEPPITFDLAPQPSRPDALAWPENLPLRDESVDCLTSFYYLRRFDDDVVHGFGGELARVLARGGSALVMEVAPVKSAFLNRVHTKLLSPGMEATDLRGWGRLAALFSECGFDAIDLVNVGPFLVPPIPRVGVLLRRAP